MHLISSIAESALCNVQGSMAHVLRFQSFYSNIYDSDKNMYKAGVARKVRICVHIATNCILCCNCVLGIMALMQPVSCVT